MIISLSLSPDMIGVKTVVMVVVLFSPLLTNAANIVSGMVMMVTG